MTRLRWLSSTAPIIARRARPGLPSRWLALPRILLLSHVFVPRPGRLAASGRGGLRHLVGVVGGRQARTDVEELADTCRASQVADGLGQEGPLLLHVGDDRGEIADRLLGAPLSAAKLSLPEY